jgi:predicted transcriptional regulator of viral defense system
LAHRICWRYKHSSDPHHSHTYTFNQATLLAFADAILEQQRAWAQQAEARAIAAESAEGQRVLAERERLRVLVQAVRDANAAEAHGDYPFRVLTARQENAWHALMAGLEEPSVAIKRDPEAEGRRGSA